MKRRDLELRTTPSIRHSAKSLLLCMTVCACTAVLGYVMFVPNFFSHASSFAGLTAASLVRLPNEDTRPIPDPYETDISAELSEETVEIVDLTGPGDTLQSLLESVISDDKTSKKIGRKLAGALRDGLNKRFDINSQLNEGRPYTFVLDSDGKFLRARLEYDNANVFHAETRGNDICTWKEDVVLEYKLDAIAFTIRDSLNHSVHAISEGQEIANKIRDIFRWDIDFHYDCRSGDKCTVLFERRYADDKPSGYGRILLAIYDGQRVGNKAAILFNEKYCNAKGIGLEKPVLVTPLRKKMRVTSRFGRRFHPIHRRYLKHNGVDLGAPIGTPVQSVAKGVIKFAGRARGYGKYVRILHENGLETRYGHLSKYRFKKGKRVRQGEVIGYVGNTGVSTGPHLDFQVVVDGVNKDPMKILKNPKFRKPQYSVDTPLKPRFKQVVEQRYQQLQECIDLRQVWQGPFAKLP